MALDYAAYREDLEILLTAALAAADPAGAVRKHLHKEGRTLRIGGFRYRLGDGRLFLISVGKAALTMGRAALEIVGDDVAKGYIIMKQAVDGDPRRYAVRVSGAHSAVTLLEAAHPVSDERSVQATVEVMKMLRETKVGDLVLCLISGGTSALLTKPYLDLPEWQQLTAHLLQSGCTINELNAVRKQLDEVKGGGLALMAQPAATVSLILSDVVGNALDVIGSGPTAPNPEPPAAALTVLHRYRARRALPRETWSRIHDLLTDPRAATSLARFEGLEVRNIIVGDVRRAAAAASAAATELGFSSSVLTAHLQGEAREVGRVAAALAKDAGAGSCLLLGGETTVTVRGNGHGGRNQELALAAAIAVEGCPQRVIASFATDGEDGPTDAAGAVVTGETVAAADAVNLDARDYLDRNDSNTFFNRLAEATEETYLLQPGPTGTNVNDLLFILAYPHS